MGDAVRNAAFAEALKRTVKKGETTLVDVGSGTGFLAFLASKLGVKHTTLIEYGDILDTSELLAKRNGIRNCTFIKKHSMEVRDLPPVDVIVSETLGNYALEENIVETVEDAKRFLKPGGTIIPGKIAQFVCLVVSDRLAKEIDVWDAGFGLDFNEAREISLHNMYVKTVRKDDLLAEKDAVKQWDFVDFSKKNSSVRQATVRWSPASKTTVYGLALWWDSELIKDVHLSTSPMEKPTHWEQIYLPLLEPIRIERGQELSLALSSDTRLKVKINLTWELKHLDAAGKAIASQKMDMMKGFIA